MDYLRNGDHITFKFEVDIYNVKDLVCREYGCSCNDINILKIKVEHIDYLKITDVYKDSIYTNSNISFDVSDIKYIGNNTFECDLTVKIISTEIKCDDEIYYQIEYMLDKNTCFFYKNKEYEVYGKNIHDYKIEVKYI